MKKVILISIFSLMLTACSQQTAVEPTSSPTSNIDTFDECAAAGYAVMESYPATCHVADGQSFIQDIGNEIELATEIVMEKPRPTSTVVNPIEIKGRARGTWFAEGTMTAELVDANDKVLGQVALTADGEWMTTEFVAFTGLLETKEPIAGKAILLIKNANPSGLPENEKVLKIPITIQ